MKDFFTKAAAVLLIALCVVLPWAFLYLVCAGLTFLICMGFSLEWSWLIALGVWAAILLVKVLFNYLRD